MEIFIKSFGRPYYLHRCLHSIRKNVEGVSSIIVLDDGTDPKYLEKISAIFPEVRIRLSPAAPEKWRRWKKHISGEASFVTGEIPHSFWKSEIAGGHDLFLLLEEDAWITRDTDLSAIGTAMRQNGIVTTKFYWADNTLMTGKRSALSFGILDLVIPDLPVSNPVLAFPFLKDLMKIRTFLFRTGIVPPFMIVPYYALYSVASAVFSREYWLFVQATATNRISEGDQLARALQWHNNMKETRYARTTVQCADTTYLTSACNGLRHVDFDMIRLNYFLSEAWYNGVLDAPTGLPGDFDEEYLSHWVPEDGPGGRSTWKKWIQSFKSQYQQLKHV